MANFIDNTVHSIAIIFEAIKIPYTIYSILKNIHTNTPHELMMCPIDFWVKDQGHNPFITENC